MLSAVGRQNLRYYTSYHPAADETIGQFSSLLFKRLFFQCDLTIVNSSWEHDVAKDAFISVNGTIMPPATFLELIKDFHSTSVATLEKEETLLMAPKDPEGRTGTVAQTAQLVVKHQDGKIVVDQSSVTIMQVGEEDGRRKMTSLVETTVERMRQDAAAV
ncbi:hypothetical protein FB45DRAFT_160516 [Roridomyces roridus]|uniref:Uncharacterized protein n=1 Tax=Roridomyces roridus TaxID=1738132 RepID=A0AAD7BFM7_9AGAR|nr:hypothetical protein FB45DRAFT_160516 [Roridomyces roridus]